MLGLTNLGEKTAKTNFDDVIVLVNVFLFRVLNII
jgi:hypothetical protein